MQHILKPKPSDHMMVYLLDLSEELPELKLTHNIFYDDQKASNMICNDSLGNECFYKWLEEEIAHMATEQGATDYNELLLDIDEGFYSEDILISALLGVYINVCELIKGAYSIGLNGNRVFVAKPVQKVTKQQRELLHRLSAL